PDADAFAKGNSVRDVKSEPAFWVVQAFGAYEGETDRSNDPNDGPKNPDLGLAADRKSDAGVVLEDDGPAIVYFETIRDVWQSYRDTFAANGVEFSLTQDEVVKRIMLHESLHRFGLKHADPPTDPPSPGDVGPLDPASTMKQGVDGASSFIIT